jgi:hypothetical protein
LSKPSSLPEESALSIPRKKDVDRHIDIHFAATDASGSADNDVIVLRLRLLSQASTQPPDGFG